MSVRYHQLHPAEAPGGQRAQEGQPEGAVFTRTHVHPDDLPLALAIDGRRHHHADVDDPAGLPDLLGQCVQPQVGVGSPI